MVETLQHQRKRDREAEAASTALPRRDEPVDLTGDSQPDGYGDGDGEDGPVDLTNEAAEHPRPPKRDRPPAPQG